MDTNTTTTVPTIPKKMMTLYWGIPVDTNIINNLISTNETIQNMIKEHNLVIRQSFHVTLLFVGKKVNESEQLFVPLTNTVCEIEIDAIGYSTDAIALRVSNIKGDSDVPFFGKQKHITIALKNGVLPVDSVNTLLGQGTILELPERITISGKVRKYL